MVIVCYQDKFDIQDAIQKFSKNKVFKIYRKYGKIRNPSTVINYNH